MPVNRFLIPVLVLVVLLATVLGAQGMGAWTTSGRTAVTSGQLKAADVKGWMTLQQVMDGLPIAQGDLYAIGKIPASVPPSTELKDLEPLAPDFSVTALRDTLAAREQAASAAGVPATAVSGEGVATRAASTHTLTPTAAPNAVQAEMDSGEAATALSSGQVLPADQIKGKMSLREISTQCAVSLNRVIATLDLPVHTNPDTLVKDLVQQGRIADAAAVQKVVAELQAQ